MTSPEGRRSTRPRAATNRPSDSYVYLLAAVIGQPAPRVLARVPAVPEGAPARAVPLGDAVSLIVTDVPAATYRPEVLEPRLADGEWVARSGAAHHAAIAALSRTDAVLPFRIFTLFSSDTRMRATLRRRSARIAKALAGLNGRDEWVLRIGPPDSSRLTAAAARQARNREVSGTGFLQLKAAATRERSERAARVQSETTGAYRALEQVADRAIAREVPPGLNVLLDAAFLIERRKLTGFRTALTRAAQPLLDEGCKVSFTGPWPAYSFASLD